MTDVKPWAVFLDIDRTLTNSKRVIPPENIETIEKARQVGHKVYINTGRSWGNIPKDLFSVLPVDGYVAGNGAHISIRGKTVLQMTMDNSVARAVCEYILSKPELWCIFECVDGVFTVLGNARKNWDNLPVIESVSDFDRLVGKKLVQVIAAGPFMSDDFVSQFSESLDVVQFPTYADCVIKGRNKAIGIEKVLEYEGLSWDRTIAVGDSANDMQMLEYCKVGVAVGNAEQKLKDIADFISLTNDEYGVSYALKKLLNL